MGAVLYSNSGSISVKPAMPTPNKNSFAIVSVIFTLLPCFYLKQSYGCVSCQFLSHVWPEYLVNFLCFSHAYLSRFGCNTHLIKWTLRCF